MLKDPSILVDVGDRTSNLSVTSQPAHSQTSPYRPITVWLRRSAHSPWYYNLYGARAEQQTGVEKTVASGSSHWKPFVGLPSISDVVQVQNKRAGKGRLEMSESLLQRLTLLVLNYNPEFMSEH